MGNALRFLCGNCCKPEEEPEPPHSGLHALARDISHFDATTQVPEGLSQHVVSSKKAQANWYRKLSEAWKESRSPPNTPGDASQFVVSTLKRHQKADVEGLLAFYGLPVPSSIAQVQPTKPTAPPREVKFELQTLPVDAKCVADGDTITIYVDTEGSSQVPKAIHTAVNQRHAARAKRNYVEADAVQKQIVDAGYRVFGGPHDEEILAKKYRIRLCGIDAPESAMPYGKEAKEELTKLVQGKSLRVIVYDEDRYGRSVGDLYCNGIFVQEHMLKKGLAWHYKAYDKRNELASWESEARAARRGLWASSNPEKPWDWRKDRRNEA
ncbi:LOW QUALITY PROTEIN: uncharacterized 38.1 kDa protein-like [Amborella trichopoda]|uniref:LOW QUALITY PROTEIN: uncharacterized 38.1 kDa protein-like n=1 Tax=Amborella trichopoda TaxID=13333 RepID=UPI0005D42B93|nr:LOW QUALITY PROTEIN: uncharacterized 38.1 kDa protein-like [Amborella trichopoda]|eukprot:XP_011627123.1 LOW QUALITY PROTEIN: uncharacterized 38.1 kDa protein-like [Amborella trichopoda]